MDNDRINLGRRKQEGTPECQINLRNRKAMLDKDYDLERFAGQHPEGVVQETMRLVFSDD